MKRTLAQLPWLGLVTAFTLAQPGSALACATCYGASDSPLAQGMNWGIITLLVIVGGVLTGIVGFFVHVGWRSRHLPNPPDA